MPEHVVTRSVVVEAAPEEAWEALVDPARLEDWFADTVEADEIAPDEEVSFRWHDGEQRDAVIEDVEAPSRLSFRWTDGAGEESRVSFHLDPHEAGTRVTVTESGLTDRAAARRASGQAAWGPRMTALSAALRSVLA